MTLHHSLLLSLYYLHFLCVVVCKTQPLSCANEDYLPTYLLNTFLSQNMTSQIINNSWKIREIQRTVLNCQASPRQLKHFLVLENTRNLLLNQLGYFKPQEHFSLKNFSNGFTTAPYLIQQLKFSICLSKLVTQASMVAS